MPTLPPVIATLLADVQGFKTSLAEAQGSMDETASSAGGMSGFVKVGLLAVGAAGVGMRAPAVVSNRSNEAGALLKPGDFDWKAIFSGGVRWFHSGGIFAALSHTTSEVIIEGMQAAKAAGAVVSFDLNYRAKLWNISGGHDRAVAVLDRIVKNVDVLVGNEEDLQMGLGIPGPETAAKNKLDPSAFIG